MKFLRHIPRWDAWITAHGRLNRLEYLWTLVLLTAPLFLAALALPLMMSHMMLRTSSFELNDESVQTFTVAAAMIAVPFTILYFLAHAKRLHDLGLPAIIALPLVIGPAVQLFGRLGLGALGLDTGEVRALLEGFKELFNDVQIGMGFYLLLAPGERGDNKYGTDPRAWG